MWQTDKLTVHKRRLSDLQSKTQSWTKKMLIHPFCQGYMQLLPNTTSQRQLTFLQLTCSLRSQSKKNSSHSPQWRGKSGRREALGRWGGGVVHRKSLTSVLCVLRVATAVSASAEHKSHQGLLFGQLGKTHRRKRPLSEKHLAKNLLLYSCCCFYGT